MAVEAPIYLSKKEVHQYLENEWDRLIIAVENALKSYSMGDVVQPVRAAVDISQNNGFLLAMPGYSIKDDALATKVVTIFPDNKSLNIPTIQAVVLLYNAKTGTLLAIIDGIVITNMRTAAASAVATKFLANRDSRILAILGAGEQARSHYKVLTHIYNIQDIRVWNIHSESGNKFVGEIQKDGYSAQYFDNVEDAVKNADIIVTVTMSMTPILQKSWVKPGAHINAVGAPSATWQELSEDLVQSAIVYVDSKAGALVESGDIIKSGADIYAEIGEVVAGKKTAQPEKTTIFKSLGMAVEDVVAAELVFKIYQNKK